MPRSVGYYPAPRSVQEVIELVGLKKRAEVRCGGCPAATRVEQTSLWH